MFHTPNMMKLHRQPKKKPVKAKHTGIIKGANYTIRKLGATAINKSLGWFAKIRLFIKKILTRPKGVTNVKRT